MGTKYTDELGWTVRINWFNAAKLIDMSLALEDKSLVELLLLELDSAYQNIFKSYNEGRLIARDYSPANKKAFDKLLMRAIHQFTMNANCLLEEFPNLYKDVKKQLVRVDSRTIESKKMFPNSILEWDAIDEYGALYRVAFCKFKNQTRDGYRWKKISRKEFLGPSIESHRLWSMAWNLKFISGEIAKAAGIQSGMRV